ncbi:MAG: hypothetical protein FI707_07870 [SAR202 cluster bacterium]|nr:hypothetical protein [Chloroflexota bacterium]MDP6421701.1 hypothetical protein [SAR202 cluster bacterium]HAL47090.1 hypothetical protein [Dehalococcoidia bacterium]MDP6662928.1 hypothetical protein [SAR202 cluster bacterium]MDP6800244.1 hypothetical protein [SAR202 cluster bacterium]
MIYRVRSAEVNGIKANEAFAWAVKVTIWANEKFPTGGTQLLRNISGNPFGLHWVSSAESLGVLDELLAAAEADPEYQAMIAEARSEGYLVPGSVTDSFSRTIP